jgi:uncharacterized protein YwgA
MRLERTREEALKDKALLLAFLSKVQTEAGGMIGDRLKMQKLVFLACYEMFSRRIKGLNLVFFTYRWGPFTKDLYETEADFEEAGLLERRGKNYLLTESGLALGRELQKSLVSVEDNAPILEALHSVAHNFSEWSTERLMDFTHGMRVIPIGWHEAEVLKDLPLHLDLTRVLEDEEATAILEIDPGWLDSLADALDANRKRFYAHLSW